MEYREARAQNYLLFLADEPLDGSIPFRREVDRYVKTRNGYSIIPPLVHSNGQRYGEQFNDVPVAVVKTSELLEVLSPFSAR